MSAIIIVHVELELFGEVLRFLAPIIVIIGSKTQTVSSYEHFPFESGQPTSGKLAPEGERLRFEVDWFLREAGWDTKLARSPPSPALMRNRGDPQNGRLRGLQYHGHPSVAAENH
jgi:hypothetical protein